MSAPLPKRNALTVDDILSAIKLMSVSERTNLFELFCLSRIWKNAPIGLA